MKNIYKTIIGIGLSYLALTGCQQVRPTRDVNGRLTESAMQTMQADEIDQERISGGREDRRPITTPLPGIQFN